MSSTGAVGIAGYSQGGHAAAWAAQIAAEWAPGLEIAGVLAGAPASEVPEFVTIDSSDERPLLRALAVIVASGLAATGDEFDLDTVLSDAGLDVLDQLEDSCEPDLVPGEPLTRADMTTLEPWASALSANVPGATPGTAPVLIVHSRTDSVVPIEHGRALARRLCDAGGTVEMRELPEGEHAPSGVPAYQQGLAWIMDLMHGATPVSTCS
ncbi:MAG: lipase family protein [Microthrixaceae bacterium]|nr:lipase family protein [Microthrixaceae bacterium]